MSSGSYDLALEVFSVELETLEKLMKEADSQYHSILDRPGGMVPTELMEWKSYLGMKHQYLKAVVEKLQKRVLGQR